MSDEFWVVEFPTDGFGNDTVVDTIWRTKKEAEQYLKDEHCVNCEIVKGFFGRPIDLVFN